MIFIGRRFVSAEHITSIDIQQMNRDSELYIVSVYTTGHASVFGKGKSDVMDEKMAIELRKRIVNAIRAYKLSDMKHTIQVVDIPTYQEIHQKDLETS